MVNGMLKSSPRDRIQRYYRGKSLSMVGSRGMVSSRKRWCCATGAKLDTCLARIVLLSLPLKKILACLSLSRVVLLHRINTLYSLILLQRFFLALNFCNNLLLWRRMWLGEIILRKLLIQIRTLCQNQSHALILVHTVSLAMGRWLLWRNPLSHLRRKPYLKILKIRPVWEGLLHRCQIQTSEGQPRTWHFGQTLTKFLETY